EELLGKYAWYISNSGNRTWPVGSLKPNDLGLFDMHGNCWTWCQDRYKDYAAGPSEKTIEDNEDVLNVAEKDMRVLRGGSAHFAFVILLPRPINHNIPASPTPPPVFGRARSSR